MNTLEAIAKRSSTRGYLPKPLTGEQIDALIRAGLQAPTATNRQELHFTVLTGDNPILARIEDEKNGQRGLADLPHNFYYEAPLVVIISGEIGFKWTPVDAGIAVENMALAAEELGLGSVILGCIYDAMLGEKAEAFAKALDFPDGYRYQIAIAFGYKDTSKEPHEFDRQKQVSVL